MPKHHSLILAPLLFLSLGCLISANLAEANESSQKDLPSARIVGGYFAIEKQFPYQVSLQIRTSHTCGGSIISATYVVTAAHCVTYREDKIVPASLLSVRAGSTLVNAGGVVKRISKVIRHPQYVEFMNDIAMLRLSTPLRFSDRIKVIPLASADPPIGAAVTISGWGRISNNGSLPTKLKSNTLRTLSSAQCKRNIGIVPPSLICLAHARGNGACSGDSGGPGVYNGTLVGVANFVVGGCGSRNPDGYARISALRTWLIENSDLE